MTVEMDCHDCEREEEFESMEEAVNEGWSRLRAGHKTSRHGEPEDGDRYDLCPDDASAKRSMELAAGVEK